MMKKILFLAVLIILGISLTACGKYNERDIIKDIDKKINKAESYKLTGVLKLINNEESYLYDVEVAYKEKDQFRVSLTNQTNNHQQIILRNKDGVFVLTPSLNKSFKFESQWPYNNSQIYILQSLMDDLNGDKKYNFEEKNNNYIFKTTVNYPNNNDLVKQKIYLDKKLNLKKVEVLDRDNQIQMKMKFDKINFSADFVDNYFNLDANMKASKTEQTSAPVSKIDNNIYPMYLPKNTYLEKEDKVSKENGERVIMTFSGDNPFMIIQETVSVENDYTTIPVSGEPTLLPDAVGAMAENELTWINNGVEYYIVSSKLKDDDLMDVASSIGVASVINQK